MMTAFELAAILTLNSEQFEQGLGKAEGKADGFGSGFKKKIGKAVKVGTAALAAFGVSSIKTGAEFDSAMSQVAATMGKTSAELQSETGKVDTAFGAFNGNLREFAQFMGKNTAFSATEAAEALNYMALAGYDAQQSMEMLPNVLNLAAAGNFDLARASDMVTDAQTAFGIDAARTTQMVDEMAKAASTGNTSVEQLGDAFLTVGGLAQELNGGMVTLQDGTTASVDGIQELEIAMTAMANAGVKGSEAGTHMRNMLLKLSSPTSDGTKQLERLGVSVFDDEGKMRSLAEIFGDLSTELGDLTQEEKIQAISDLFNTRDLASAEALLNAVGEDWDKIGESILDADGAAAKMEEEQLNNLAGDVTHLQSAFEGLQIAISDIGSGALRTAVQGITSFISTLTDAVSAGNIEGMLKMFDDAFTNLYINVVAGLRNAIDAIKENLPNMIPAIMEGLESFSGVLRERIGSLVDLGLELVQTIADGIIQNLPVFIETIPTIISNLAGIINDNAPKILQVGGTILLHLAKGLIEAIPTLVANIPQILQAIGDVFMAFQWAALGKSLIKKVGEGILKAGSFVRSKASSVAKQIPKAIKSGVGNLLKIGKQFIQDLASGAVSAGGGLLSKVRGVASKIPSAIKNAVGSLWSIGHDMIAGLWNGIKARWDTLVGALKEKAANLPKAVKKVLGIESPSKVFAEVGKWIPLGLAKGIDDNADSVDKAIEGMVDPSLATTNVTGNFGGTMDANTFTMIKMLVSELAPYLQEGMADALEGMKVTLDNREFGRMTRKAVAGRL